MRDYEEKSYYEIQLDNKQLILVFLAAVTVCVLIFVLGVMIGKGQKEAEIAAETRGGKNVAAAEPDPNSPPQPLTDIASEARSEEKSSPKKPVVEKSAPVMAEQKQEQKEEKKEKPKSAAATKEKPEEKYAYEDLDKTEQAPVVEKVKPEKTEKTVEPPPKAETVETAEAEPTSTGGSQYTVQIMATSSKPKAEEQISILKKKGYKPFMDETKTGAMRVFKVRVGRFVDTDEAKDMASRIKNDLKLETWVAVLD